MTGYRTCLDCPAPVKFSDRVRCHACHRRVTRAALNAPARTAARFGTWANLASASSAGVAPCRAGQPRRSPAPAAASSGSNARQGLCNRCSLADPDRPFRYSAAVARRLRPVPAWWDDLTAFAVARHHPGGAIVILREAGRLLAPTPMPARSSSWTAAHRPPAQPGGPCADSSPAAAWPCPETKNSAVPRHAGATSRRGPGRLAAAVAAFNGSQLENGNEHGAPDGTRSATSPWRPGSGSSATWPST